MKIEIEDSNEVDVIDELLDLMEVDDSMSEELFEAVTRLIDRLEYVESELEVYRENNKSDLKKKLAGTINENTSLHQANREMFSKIAEMYEVLGINIIGNMEENY